MTTPLQQAIEAIRAGKKSDARRLLARIVTADRKNVHAWFLLSYAAETKEQKIACLHRVLALSPTHVEATKRLATLGAVPRSQKDPVMEVQPNIETVEQAKTLENRVKTSPKGTVTPTSTAPSMPVLDDLVEQWLAVLTFRERKVLEYLYLNEETRFSVTAIGRIISVSSEEVNQMNRRAFAKLREEGSYAVVRPFVSLLFDLLQSSGKSISESKLDAELRRKLIVQKIHPLGVSRLIFALEGKGSKDLLQSEAKLTGSPTQVNRQQPEKARESTNGSATTPKPQERLPARLSPKSNRANLPKNTVPAKQAKNRIAEKLETPFSVSIQSQLPAAPEKVLPDSGGMEVVEKSASLPVVFNKPRPTITRNLWQTFLDDKPKIDNLPNTVELLVADVTSLPIITNPHQELWLGVQLQATRRLALIVTKWKSQVGAISFPQFLCQSLTETWTLLQQQAQAQELLPPRLDVWASELLMARRNVYALRRSRMRRFIRRVQAVTGKDVAEGLLESTYQAAETLAILSDGALAKLAEFASHNQNLLPVDEIVRCLPVDLDVIEQQVRRRAEQVQQILTTGYLRYAMRVAQGHIGRGLDYADLVQAGFMGLLRAAGKFDYRVQARFGTYATSWIWQAVGREIADHSRTIRVPVHVQEVWRKWENACNQYDDGRDDPTCNLRILYEVGFLNEKERSEIEKSLLAGKSLSPKLAKRRKEAIKKARQLRTYQTQFLSIEEALVSLDNDEIFGDAISLSDLIPDIAPSPDKIADEALVQQVIQEQVLARLDSKEQEVLELRYGLLDGRERTLEEIGTLWGVTRERIRQIEAKALKKLENRITLGLLPDLRDLAPPEQPHLTLPSELQIIQRGTVDEKFGNEEPKRISTLLAKLPRSDWLQRRSGANVGQRREQLVAALQALATPAHVADIAEQLNGTMEGKELDDAYVYNLLAQDEKTFILLGKGIFSLVEWQQDRAKQQQPVLACCPMPLPDPPGYEDAFFESTLVGQQALVQGMTAGQFARHMLGWAKAETEQQNWFIQSILSAYYLVDLIPYVFYFGGHNPLLSCTLPQTNIHDLRYHCLEALTTRLVAMPEFWWLVQQQQPIRPVDLGELFADVHPYGLDDVLQRLRLLASLGAAQRLRYGTYRLTPLGEDCANCWKKEPVLETTVIPEPDLIDDFASLVAW